MVTSKDNNLFDNLFSYSNNIQNNIDIVYTFVDTSDEKWKNKASKYGRKPSGIRYDTTHILFSLQSVQKYFPSVNKIYIVSDDQKINTSSVPQLSSKIIHVDHREIIPKKYLPTFNSLVIESFLWRIPELSNNFLYFNDDFILGQPINLDIFFNEDKKLIQFYVESKRKQSGHPWYKNISESNLLFAEKFSSYVPFLYPQHSIYHLQKQHFKKTYYIFEKKLLHMFENHKFRNYNKSHNLIFLTAMFMHHNKLAINKKSSFKHIFRFTPELIQSTIEDRKTFYAIASSLDNDKKYYEEFKQKILQ